MIYIQLYTTPVPCVSVGARVYGFSSYCFLFKTGLTVKPWLACNLHRSTCLCLQVLGLKVCLIPCSLNYIIVVVIIAIIINVTYVHMSQCVEVR